MPYMDRVRHEIGYLIYLNTFVRSFVGSFLTLLNLEGVININGLAIITVHSRYYVHKRYDC